MKTPLLCLAIASLVSGSALAQITGSFSGSNSSGSPFADFGLSNGNFTVSGSDIQPFPTLCTPMSVNTNSTCQFSGNFSRTFQGGSNFGSFSFSGGVFLRSASSVTISITSEPVTVNLACAGVPSGSQCSNTSASGQIPVTINGQIRIFDTSGQCLWCSDFTGTGTLNGTQFLANTGSSYHGTYTANERTVAASQGLHFVPVTPCRIADTRDPAGVYGQPALVPAAVRNFPITGKCGVPSNAIAASLNVTVIPRGTLGYLTVWPAGTTQPNVSLLNSLDGRIKANAAIVQLGGVDRAVSLFATHAAEAIIDINGYFVSPGQTTLAFYPVTPCRVLDTRNAPGALGGPALLAANVRTIPVLSSSCGIPSNAQAYSLNATVVPPAGFGYLTLWPSGTAQPVVSTLNAVTGTVVANAAIVPAGTNGAIEAFASGNTDLVLDINGYFAPAGQAGALQYYPTGGCRVSDTRNANGALGGPIQTGGLVRDYPVPSSGCGIPTGARAFAMNATLLPNGPTSFLTLFPSGQGQPLASTLNALDGAFTSNAAIVPASSTGSLSAFVTQTSHLLLDISGYFLP
ncbi:hypothetical protein F183_A46880 [Bryobacterales bacterium F-183]|nr:hypothetical protein F183_A46880 [Bryobacterales bacterium F-183]